MSLAQKVTILAAGSIVGAQAGLTASNIRAFTGYTGSFSVSGKAEVGQALGDQIVLWYSFTGADPACDGSATTAANACGIQIHRIASCEVVGMAGAFQNVGGDPWATAQYRVTSGTAADMNVVVQAGTTLAENTEKAVVVHDASGNAIACGLLEADAEVPGTRTFEAKAFSKYPGYAGSLASAGAVTLTQTQQSGAVVLDYSLTGVDPACLSTADMSAGNACGIHVHVGACSDAQGHYYVGSADPWAKVVYFSGAERSERSPVLDKTGASVSVEIDMGASVSTTKGRSLVVHDLTGARVACSEIQERQTSGSPRASVGPLIGLVVVLFSFAK